MNGGIYTMRFLSYRRVNRGRRRVSRNDLATILDTRTDEELYNAVNELIDDSVLAAPKSGTRIKTNGNVKYPVYDSYSIILTTEEELNDKTVSEILETIHPALCANGYLIAHPEKYRKYRSETIAVSTYLYRNPGLHNRVILSRRERSYQIFGDEKLLEKGSGSNIRHGSQFVTYLSNIGATQQLLNYYDETDDNFRAYIRESRDGDPLTLIVCENKDIWDHIGRLIIQATTELQRTFFGVKLDGAICSWGNSAARPQKLTQWTETFMKGRAVHFLYFGDIDQEGVRIYGRIKEGNPGLDIQPCTSFYDKALDLVEECHITPRPSNDHRNMSDTWCATVLMSEFEKKTAERMLRYLRDNLIIPQEIINNEVLQNEIAGNERRRKC